MPAQNNTGRQYDKTHALTQVATAILAEARFVAYDGDYPVPIGAVGVNDVQGVTENAAAAIGDPVSVITGYSALVEAAEAIAFGAFVTTDAAGKAAVGSTANYCGRALGAATVAGQLIEVQLLPHVHPIA